MRLGCTLTVADVDPLLGIQGNHDLLLAALMNLLHNAFKFTHPASEVMLTAYARGVRILIDVKDHCGGLPPGDAEKMFTPFTQRSEDKTGLSLGLSIARKSVEADSGLLHVRDMPGIGCIFTIDLPGYSLQRRESDFRLIAGQRKHIFAAGMRALVTSGNVPKADDRGNPPDCRIADVQNLFRENQSHK